MVLTVIGKKKGKFTNDKGENIKYAKCICVFDFDKNTLNEVEGKDMGSFSCLEEDTFKNIPLNTPLNVYFDKSSKIDAFTVIKQ